MSDKGIVCPSCGKPAKLASVVYEQQDTGWHLIAPPKKYPIPPFENEQSKYGGCIWIPLLVLLISVIAGLGRGFNNDTFVVIVGCLIAMAFGISTLPKAIARNKVRRQNYEMAVEKQHTQDRSLERQWRRDLYYCRDENIVFNRRFPEKTRSPVDMMQLLDRDLV